LIDDAIKTLELWACFTENSKEDKEDYSDLEFYPQRFEDSNPSDYLPKIPIQNKSPKVGRNEPCPCGSGKKYKKCCLSVH